MEAAINKVHLHDRRTQQHHRPWRRSELERPVLPHFRHARGTRSRGRGLAELTASGFLEPASGRNSRKEVHQPPDCDSADLELS